MHAPGIGASGAGDVSGHAVVRAGADKGKPGGDVDRGAGAGELERYHGLVVVGRDDAVVLAGEGVAEQGVGGNGAEDLDVV